MQRRSAMGNEYLDSIGRQARGASQTLTKSSSTVKDDALLRIADGLLAGTQEILAANERDLEAGTESGLSEAALGRLMLDAKKLDGIAGDVRTIVALPDPTAESFDGHTLANGLKVSRQRVPLGVIGVIYESRPNVTVDISAICLKSGNAAILRGGKEALHSNTALARLVRDSIVAAGGPEHAVQFIESTDRSLVGHMLKMAEFIDLIIPRGGADLVRRVAREAEMPAVTGGIGVCHAYIDRAADLDMAVAIAFNAKTSSPHVCNALDTLLVHADIAPAYVPRIAARLGEAGVGLRCDQRALGMLEPSGSVTAAAEEDWGREFLALIAAIKVVDSIDEALGHIERYGSGHTDSIITEDYTAADRFLNEVDASVVMVNASTRFNDGGQLGLGAEVAISTNKLHARGPMGLRELTSYKWTVIGEGQVRP